MMFVFLTTGTLGCTSRGQNNPATAPPSSLCDALFANGKTRFLGRGYANQKNTNGGFLWVTFTPTESEDGPALQARLRSFFGARLFRRAQFDTGRCQQSPDPRFALITLANQRGAQLQLWLWGENNVPQHESRLMGYLAFNEDEGAGTKIALWHR